MEWCTKGLGRAALPWSQVQWCQLWEQVRNCPHGLACPGAAHIDLVISIIISSHSMNNNCLVAFPGMLPAISSLKCRPINNYQKEVSDKESQSAEWQANGGWLRLSLHTVGRGSISEERKRKLHNEIKRVQKVWAKVTHISQASYTTLCSTHTRELMLMIKTVKLNLTNEGTTWKCSVLVTRFHCFPLLHEVHGPALVQCCQFLSINGSWDPVKSCICWASTPTSP